MVAPAQGVRVPRGHVLVAISLDTAKVSSALRDIWDEVGTGPLLIYADILTLQTKEAFHVAQTQSTSVSWPLIVGLLLEFPLRFPVKYRSSPEMVVLR